MFSSGLGVFGDDVSGVLPRRAQRGVSLDPRSSLRALLEESRSQPRNTPVAQLTLMYAWLDRIESSFADSCVFDGIANRGSTAASVELPCGPLGAFVSPDRQRALAMCGWSDLCTPATDTAAASAGSLEALSSLIPVPIVRDCLRDGDVERAAAIALLHGLVEVAVQILSFAATSARLGAAGGSAGALEAELLQLTAMALAGW